MDKRKSRRTKLFPCFRPDAAVDDDCEAVISKGKIMHSDESSLSSSSDGDSSLDGGRRSQGSSRRRLSRAIKAVLFDTSLTRKIRERRSRKNTFRSNGSLSVKGDQIIANDKSSSLEGSTDVDEMNRINSTRSSSIFSASTNASSLSSSCSSSRNANSLSSSGRRGSSRDNSMEKGASFRVANVPLERKESIRGSTKALESQKQNTDYQYSSTVGVCLLLTSLLVLIFWGKICAILCTSVWLFFGPRRIKSAVSKASMPAVTVNVDSEEYKKRVIMEGLLRRNRSRAGATQ